jgi:hypothetical protein
MTIGMMVCCGAIARHWPLGRGLLLSFQRMLGAQPYLRVAVIEIARKAWDVLGCRLWPRVRMALIVTILLFVCLADYYNYYGPEYGYRGGYFRDRGSYVCS